jgi:hypothetical protein
MWRKHKIYAPLLQLFHFGSICFLGNTMEPGFVPRTQIVQLPDYTDVYFLAYATTLKREAKYSRET